jgi:hypothetical protein
VEHARQKKVELCTEFSLQSKMSATEDVTSKPWHLQIITDGFQSAGGDVDCVDWRANSGHEHEIVRRCPPSPPAKLDQYGKQKLGNWKIPGAGPVHIV